MSWNWNVSSYELFIKYDSAMNGKTNQNNSEEICSHFIAAKKWWKFEIAEQSAAEQCNDATVFSFDAIANGKNEKKENSKWHMCQFHWCKWKWKYLFLFRNLECDEIRSLDRKCYCIQQSHIPDSDVQRSEEETETETEEL